MNRIIVCWLLLCSKCAFSQDLLSQFPLRQTSEYFDFRFKSNSTQIGEISCFADGFIKVVNREFFQANFDFPVRVLVFEDRPKFKAFLNNELKISDAPNFGIYLRNYKLFATYEGSGLGTFAHEIMHPLVERNLTNRPLWAVEGIPTFFEKFYGYWKNHELVLYWGFQNPWRIEQLGTNLTHLNLRQIIADPVATSHMSLIEKKESSWRMASMFLWENGCFKRFLKLIASNDKVGYPTFFEAAMDMPIEKIIPIWQKYLNDVESRRSQILLLPPSKVFQTEAEFAAFIKSNNISMPESNAHRQN